MSLEFSRTPRKRTTVEIIPLIDVAMFLLIFFMVAGVMEKFEIIDVTPPRAESGKLVDEGHMVVLLGKREELVLDDAMVTLPELEAEVHEQVAANPNKIITLKADASIPAVRMIAVLDRIKAAGGRNLSVATQSGAAK